MTPPREIRVALDDLRDIVHYAERLAKLLPDLHVLAYDRPVTSEAVRSSRSAWYLDEQGSPPAKDALRAVTAERGQAGVKAARAVLAVHVATIEALFRGPGADTTLRGTLLGDEEGNGAQRELTEALKAQAKREAAGEYTPARSEPQQKRVPGR